MRYLSSPWIRTHSLFSKIVNGLLFGWTLWMYRRNLQSIDLPVPEILVIEVLGWGCEPQSWGRGHRQSGMVPFETAFVTSYMVGPPLFLYLYAFHRYFRFVLQQATLWGTKSEGVVLIVRAVSFPECEAMLSSDKTDRRTTCNRNTTLCTVCAPCA